MKKYEDLFGGIWWQRSKNQYMIELCSDILGLNCMNLTIQEFDDALENGDLKLYSE